MKGVSLNVESTEGEGSNFTFTNCYDLIDNSREEVVPKLGISELSKFENVSVLVAEDNAVNQFMIKKVLANRNLNVEVVDNGQKVLESLESNKFDIILMDTHMPVMGGFEATRHIRSNLSEVVRNIPIISLSAAVLEEEKQLAYDAGVNDIVTKPFDHSVLHHKIGKLVKKN